MELETPRLSEGHYKISKKTEGETVILPVTHRRGRRSVFKSLFFAFLLVFFALCVWLVITRLIGDGDACAAAVSALFAEHGMGVPK